MNRCFILASILFGFTTVIHGQGIPYTSFGKCSYTGDPHLIPFPSSSGQASNMYYCQKNRWETVLQNKWVYILAKSGPSPYVVLDFIVVFYNANQDIVCVLIASSGLLTCPTTSPVYSITTLGGTTWNHWYPDAQYFNLQISSFSWGTGKRYDLVIRQTFDLISQSSGLCVKPDCPLEQLIATPPPIIITICNIYITSVQKVLVGRVNEYTGKLITTACQNDLMTAYNPKFGQTAAIQYVDRSLDQTAGENYQTAVLNIGDQLKAALAVADRQVAAVIGKNDTCSTQRRCFANEDD